MRCLCHPQTLRGIKDLTEKSVKALGQLAQGANTPPTLVKHSQRHGLGLALLTQGRSHTLNGFLGFLLALLALFV